MSIFKACDIRGIYGSELTDRDAYELGLAAGGLAGGQPALAAGDVRLSTPALKEALCAGLADSGCQVTDAGILTTPAFYFAVHSAGSAVGIMVTASHNPAEYNGFKLLIGGRPVNQGELELLRQAVAQKNFSRGQGGIRQDDSWLPRYRDKIIGSFGGGNCKVALDCGNGSCALAAPAIFQSLGYRVTELYCTPDGSFPNRSPNPSVPENLDALRRCVVGEGAAVGIAYDGDGDRVAVVDETGQVIENDRLLALFARRLLAGEKGVIVYDSKCSLLVAEEIARLGGTPLMARSGHAFVGNRFIESNALLAGELSGHFFWRELGFDDGIYSSLSLLELLREEGLPLSLLNGSLPRYLITPDIRLPLPGSLQKIIDGVTEKLSGYPISHIDGVRLDLKDCWGMVRPSITEPILTLRFEGKTGERLSYITGLMLSALPGEIRRRAEEIVTSLPVYK